jgi:hypothetical protein
MSAPRHQQLARIPPRAGTEDRELGGGAAFGVEFGDSDGVPRARSVDGERCRCRRNRSKELLQFENL